MIKLSDIVFFFLCVFASYILMQQIYTIGYVSGFYNARDTSYVRKRIIKEGNILKYPFGKACGETAKASECDSVKQVGQEPEKEGA